MKQLKKIKLGEETDPETRKALQGLVLDSEKNMLQKEIAEGRTIQCKGILGGVQMANGLAFAIAGFASDKITEKRNAKEDQSTKDNAELKKLSLDIIKIMKEKGLLDRKTII